MVVTNPETNRSIGIMLRRSCVSRMGCFRRPRLPHRPKGPHATPTRRPRATATPDNFVVVHAGGDGLVSTKAAAAVMTAACAAMSDQAIPARRETRIAATIAAAASNFAFGAIAPCRFQSRIACPKRGCPISHRCSLSEPLAKQNAARIMNGVVGRSGSVMPTRPSATQAIPAAAHSRRTGDVSDFTFMTLYIRRATARLRVLSQ